MEVGTTPSPICTLLTIVKAGTEFEATYSKAEVERALQALEDNMNKSRATKRRSGTTPASEISTLIHFSASTDDGTRIYPHKLSTTDGRSADVINELEKSPNSKKKVPNTVYLEFPLMQNKSEYEGGDPGPDRVIAIVYGQKSKDYSDVYFSMVATHTGAETYNDFVPCTPVH